MKKVFNNTYLICLGIGATTGTFIGGFINIKDYFVLALIFGLATAIFIASHGKTKSPLSK